MDVNGLEAFVDASGDEEKRKCDERREEKRGKLRQRRRDWQ